MAYKRSMEILESKLLPPHLGRLLIRPRLSQKLCDLTDMRLILVTAGAGYGKTSVVAQALVQPSEGKEKRTLVWYRLDRFDRDVTTFMAYLVQGLEKAFQGFSEALPDSFFNYGSPKLAQARLLAFLKALESVVDRETSIVLDDFHLLGRRSEDADGATSFLDVFSCLDFLLGRLPRHVRLVLISRTEPPLKLSTLRVRQQVLEIHEPDLAFTPGETGSLFSRVHGRDLDEKDLGILHRQTGGWAAGLVLFAAALKGGGGRGAMAQVLDSGGSRHHIFNFLEENLFETQSKSMQAFMVKTALMDPMETRICDRLAGIEDSRACFRRMMGAHLMVFPMDGRETFFHYHHLFRDFLLEKLQCMLGRSEIQSLHMEVAGLLEAEKNFTALVHYIEAGAYEDAVRFLEVFELEFLLQGKIHFVRTCLEKIPKDIIAENPRLLFMEAKQYSYFGRPDKAISCLTAACRIFRQANSGTHVAKCLVDLAAQYYYTGHIPEARDLIAQVLDESRADPGTYILAVTYLTFFCAVLGDMRAALAYDAEARALIEGFSEFERTAALAAVNTSRTYIHFIKGEFEKSMALNLHLVAQCESDGLEAFLPLAYYHAAATDCVLGNYETGLAYAEKGIRAAEKIHLRDSQMGWIYLALSENQLGLEQMEKAETNAASAMEIFRQPGNRWGIANAQNQLAKIRLACGDVEGAHSRVSRALDIIAGYGLPMTEAIITITRARVLMASGSFESALACLAETRRALNPFACYLCLSWLLGACCCRALNRKAATWRHFQKGLAVSRKNNLDRFVLSEAGTLIREMAAYTPRTIFSGYLDRLQARLEPARTGLRIQVLGGFRVFAESREILESEWTSSKSLILFQYLALHQSRGFIPKDVLVETAWPEQDPDRAGKRFNTAMSQLRKILEPDLPARSPSTYIHRKKDQYRLELGAGGRLDLGAFLDRSDAALGMAKTDPGAAFDLGREAVGVYRGTLLEGVLYLDWCNRLREETSARFCRVCRMLAEFSRDRGEPEAAIRYAEKFLREDPFDEPMYQCLMSSLAETGRTGRARQVFRTCRERMAEIDCPLSPETLSLHKKLAENPDRTAPDLDKI